MKSQIIIIWNSTPLGYNGNIYIHIASIQLNMGIHFESVLQLEILKYYHHSLSVSKGGLYPMGTYATPVHKPMMGTAHRGSLD